MNRSTRTLLCAADLRCWALLFCIAVPASVSAQITAPRVLSGDIDRTARLEEQLINRLHATTDSQAAYLRYVVKLVEQRRLETRLVLAVQQYALRRNPRYAFPFFERALRYEASKRGVELPPIRHFQSTADTIR